MKWSKEEAKQLIYLLEDGWSWQFPGYKWCSERLNNEFGNNRTPNACRVKYTRATIKSCQCDLTK